MVTCSNELNAGYAADGYARLSQTHIAVVVITYMVGSLSLINAIAGAYSENLKLIVISGGLKSTDYGTDKLIHHSIGKRDKDQPSRMFSEVTCASVRLQDSVNCADTIDSVLSKCLQQSLPVYIEVPDNLVQLPQPAPRPLLLHPSPTTHLMALNDAISSITECYLHARAPIIIVGGLARHWLSLDAMSSLASTFGCPVFCLPDGKSLISEQHPLFSGVFWSIASDASIHSAVMGSDLWLTIGCRWTDSHTIGEFLDISKEQGRMIDIQEWFTTLPNGETCTSISATDVLYGLIGSDLPQQIRVLTPSSKQEKPQGDHTDGHSHIKRQHILQGLQGFLGPRDILLADTGDSWFNAASIKLPEGTDFQIQILYSSLGWGLPATLGAQLARHDGRAVLLVGDGGFQMTSQELSTMIRLNLNPVIVVMNNCGYQFEVRQ